jgi:DNA repair exonuclease SbcCD ATPase subunit
VHLHNFSIYRKAPEVAVSVDRDVFCLAGANGLGKSSFIAALSYGITGAVAPTRGRIEQLSDYLSDAKRYAREYFDGRITELDRESSSIRVEFEVGEATYSLTRKFFSQPALVELTVTRADQELRLALADGDDVDAEYENAILEDTGLETFSQFVFLYHFVFTFDERRHLLFWDARASELVLYLALGLDPILATKTDELRKSANAAGSLARNSQYQATSARSQLTALIKSLEGKRDFDPEIVAEYQELRDLREKLARGKVELDAQLLDARLSLATASAEHMRLRRSYDDTFRERLSQGLSKSLHPLISETLDSGVCQVCGTHEPAGLERIRELVRSQRCPLCDSELPQATSSDEWVSVLAEIDGALAATASRVAGSDKAVRRLEIEIESNLDKSAEVEKRIDQLENEYDISLEKISTEVDRETRGRIQVLESAIEVALQRKEEQLELRAQALAEFEPIRNALVSAWRDAEADFVPRFRSLAEGFIGLPLYIQLDEGAGMMGSAHLALSVNETRRRTATQLSESQRFFLDIALRMVLAKYMNGDRGESSLIIDTPEGALDIAYEARAGDLLAAFAENGDQLLMTANINSSQLLLRMAKRCGDAKMQFLRMTAWTTLSRVQQEEEGLFEKAFADIEGALSSSGVR